MQKHFTLQHNSEQHENKYGHVKEKPLNRDKQTECASVTFM